MKLDCKFCWNNYLLYNDLYIIKIIMYVPYICFKLIQSLDKCTGEFRYEMHEHPY